MLFSKAKYDYDVIPGYGVSRKKIKPDSSNDKRGSKPSSETYNTYQSKKSHGENPRTRARRDDGYDTKYQMSGGLGNITHGVEGHPGGGRYMLPNHHETRESQRGNQSSNRGIDHRDSIIETQSRDSGRSRHSSHHSIAHHGSMAEG